MSVVVGVKDLNDKQVALIRELLTIIPKHKNSFSSGFDASIIESIQCWIDLDGYCYLPYAFAVRLLGHNPNLQKKFPTADFVFTSTLRQNKYVDQVDDVTEALLQLEKYNTTRLELHTGRGKTVEAAYILSVIGGLSLVVVPRIGLLDQWKNTFDEHTTADSWVIDTPIPKNISVIITTPGKIHKIDNQLGPGWLAWIQNLVIDEAHMFCTPTLILPLLQYIQTKNIIACTATFNRSNDGLDKLMTAFVGTHKVYRKSTKPFTVIKYMTGITVPIERNIRGQTDWSKLVNSLVANQQRNIQILRLVKENYTNFKILVLTWRVTHAKQLSQWINHMGIKADYIAGTKKSYLDSNVLIGTSQKIGTGFDEKAACSTYNGIRINLMILTGSTKTPELLEQWAGRGMRADKPTIIHMVDDMAIIKRHWTSANKWYKSRNATITKFNSQYYNKKHKHNKKSNLEHKSQQSFLLTKKKHQCPHVDITSTVTQPSHKTNNSPLKNTSTIKLSSHNCYYSTNTSSNLSNVNTTNTTFNKQPSYKNITTTTINTSITTTMTTSLTSSDVTTTSSHQLKTLSRYNLHARSTTNK